MWHGRLFEGEVTICVVINLQSDGLRKFIDLIVKDMHKIGLVLMVYNMLIYLYGVY